MRRVFAGLLCAAVTSVALAGLWMESRPSGAPAARPAAAAASLAPPRDPWPEPASLGLVALGGFGLAFRKSR